MGKDEQKMDAPTTTDLLSELTRVVSMLAAKPAENADLLSTLTAAMNRIADTQEKGAELVALETKRAHRPSNEQAHLRSVFNQCGFPLPPLKCPIFMPWPMDTATCTREEIELMNLLEPGAFKLERTDSSILKVALAGEYALDGKTLSKLTLGTDPPNGTGFDNENAKLLPSPFSRWLRQMLEQSSPEVQQKLKRVLTMKEEAALIAAGTLAVAA